MVRVNSYMLISFQLSSSAHFEFEPMAVRGIKLRTQLSKYICLLISISFSSSYHFPQFKYRSFIYSFVKLYYMCIARKVLARPSDWFTSLITFSSEHYPARQNLSSLQFCSVNDEREPLLAIGRTFISHRPQPRTNKFS